MKKKKYSLTETMMNEEGNVLLFAILILLFLVFMTSIISGAVINRATIAREITDANKSTANLEQGNVSVESAIDEMNYQNDELARYYVSMNYYTKGTNSFTGGTNPSLDSYLNGLIRSDFQKEVKQAMQNNLNVEECASAIFTYLTLRRGTANSLEIVVEGNRRIDVSLKSFMRVNMSGHAGYELSDITITPTITNFNYANVRSLINGNKILDISYKGKFNTNSSNIKSEETLVSGETRSISYIGNSNGTMKEPNSTTLKGSYKINKYQNVIIKK